jgi:hypothetical protein
MNDRDLLRFGKSARYMCSPEANLGKEPRKVFVIQLREAVKGRTARAESEPLSCPAIAVESRDNGEQVF